MFQKFDIEDRDIFKTCVIATMSSGKSTFINSLIGDEILPEKNEACTARTMAVLNNDQATEKKAHIIRNNRVKEVVTITNRDVLDQINNDTEVSDFLVETNIDSITNTSRALMVIDTPGVNNSEDISHGERTQELLNQINRGLIIYLLNATALATTDDAILLEMVSQHKKKNPEVSILFVVNKIDALDDEVESIKDTVTVAKEYIESHGFVNPVIYPLSALSAKLLKMSYYHKEMTRRELRRLEEIYENYKPNENSMLSYAITDDYSGDKFEIGEYEISGQELSRAIENTGIVAIENKIQEIMRQEEERYAPKVVIKSTFSETVLHQYHERIKQLSELKFGVVPESWKLLLRKAASSVALANENPHQQYIQPYQKLMDASQCNTGNCFDLILSDLEMVKDMTETNIVNDQLRFYHGSTNKYFIPAADTDHKVKGKDFYLVSGDLVQWKALEFASFIPDVEAGKEVYLHNLYTGLFIKVTANELEDIVPLLDIELPAALLALGNIKSESVCITVQEAAQYIAGIDTAYRTELDQIKVNQQRLERTYKGIEFSSIEEKNQIIAYEKEAQEFCLHASNETYAVLRAKKEEYSNAPSAIFSEFLVQIIAAMAAAENREIADYIQQISVTELDDLKDLNNQISEQKYSAEANNRIRLAIVERTKVCQQGILEGMISQINELDRNMLKQVADQVRAMGYPDQINQPYLDRIAHCYDLREQRDLSEMCSTMDASGIDELKALYEKLVHGDFQERFVQPYQLRVDSRIDFLYQQQLEAICQPLSQSERQETQMIQEKINQLACKETLKTEFRNRVSEHIELLDQRDLEQLTANIEDKSLEEAELIYKELLSGKYNAKFINPYLMSVRLCVELKQQHKLEEMTADVTGFNKAACEQVETDMKALNYENRVSSASFRKLNCRIFELDMLELMDLCNDFDALSKEEVIQMRSLSNQKKVKKECLKLYDQKLVARENAIAIQNTSPYAFYMKQIMENQQIVLPEFQLVPLTEYFMVYKEQFCKLCGVSDVYEMPIFVFSKDVYLAMTQTHVYAKVNSAIQRFAVDNIQSFTTVKKLLFEGLMIQCKDGRSVTLSGSISKKVNGAFAWALNEMLHCIQNPELVQAYQPIHVTTPGLDINYLVSLAQQSSGEYEYWEEKLVNEFLNNKGSFHFASWIRYRGEAKWENNETKAINNMGITTEQSLVMYYDPTLLNSAKEGIAVGRNYLYLKKSNQPLIAIKVSDIMSILPAEQASFLKVQTVSHGIYRIENINFKNDEAALFAGLLDTYVKNIQLVDARKMADMAKEAAQELYAGTNESDNGLNSQTSESGAGSQRLWCSACGVELPIDAKFCYSCGSRVSR